MAQTVYAALLWTVILFLSITAAQAGQVTLAWNASSGAAGYHVYYRQQSGSYPATPQQSTASTTATVSNLTDGAKYYFVVRAHDGKGMVSVPSNEVSKTLGTTAPSTGTPPPSGALPSPWYGWDIGEVGQRGSSSYANGVFTLKGSGADIWGTTDAFHFVYQPLTGDGSIVARVVSVGNTARWAKAGVMIRENLDANARNAFALVSPNTGGVFFQYRTSTGGGSVERAGAVVGAPYWVKLTRTGNTITAHQSANGASWTQIGSVTLSVGSTVYVGLAVTSTNNTALNTTTFDNVSVSTSTTGATTGPTTGATTTSGSLPSPWYGWDIGNVGQRGSSSYANDAFTLRGSGTDIWGTADAFRFTYQSLNGDGSIVARVASLTETDSWAKAGVMIRENLDANAPHAMVVVTPSNGVAFQRRTTTGGSSAHTAGAAVAAPYWVKLTRTGNTFTAYQSTNVRTWTQIGSAFSIPMPTSVYVGLAITSHANSVLATATLDSVSVE